ncbi:MAG: DUF2141 domain-containing protein [Sphingomonas sp.]
MTIAKMLLAAASFAAASPAAAQAARAPAPLGDDAAACIARAGPAIQVNVIGLKDRTGRLKLELYPDNEADFLKDDHTLVKEGKFFRRVWAKTPAQGAVSLCIRAPHPGKYALLFTHDRDLKNKFNFWQDGAGFVSMQRLGRTRPKVDQAEVAVGAGVTVVTIRVQYLRGVSGFAPVSNN